MFLFGICWQRSSSPRKSRERRGWRHIPQPATIDDPAILAEIGAILSRAGYARREAG
jgi:hypothetical protein